MPLPHASPRDAFNVKQNREVLCSTSPQCGQHAGALGAQVPPAPHQASQRAVWRPEATVQRGDEHAAARGYHARCAAPDAGTHIAKVFWPGFTSDGETREFDAFPPVRPHRAEIKLVRAALQTECLDPLS